MWSPTFPTYVHMVIAGRGNEVGCKGATEAGSIPEEGVCNGVWPVLAVGTRQTGGDG
jgi:hypothetical protein